MREFGAQHLLQREPPGERAGEGELVDELEVAAERHAGGQAGDGQIWEVLEQAGQVGGGGFAFGVGVGGEDDFGDLGGVVAVEVGKDAADALQQGRDGEVLGAHVRKWVRAPPSTW